MSKTNHRVNKDRPAKDEESEAHRRRRQASRIIEQLSAFPEMEYDDEYDEIFDDPDLRFEKIRKKRG